MKLAAIFKWLGIALGVIVLLIAALLAYVAFVFDANAYKSRITQFVADKYQRTLTIDGDLKLSVFPDIAVALPHCSLSEPRAKTMAAEVGSARVSLALWPLLRKEIRVGEVALDGLKTSVVKGKDGKTNFDDFLGGEDKGAQTPAAPNAGAASGGAEAASFDIGGVRISNSAVAYRDLAAGHEIALSQIELKVGRLADKSAVPLDLSVRIDGKQPAVAGMVTAHGKALLDLGAKRYGAEGLNAKFDGNFAGAPLAAQIDLAKLDWTPEKFDAPSVKIAVKRGGADAADLTLTLDGASGSPAAISVKQLAATARLGGEKAARTIALDMKSPLAVNLDALSVVLGKLDGRVKVDDPAMPIKSIDMPISGRVAVDAKGEKIDGNIDTKLDESAIAAKFNVAGFAKPAIGFDLNIDRINVDKYVNFAPAAGAKPSTATPAPAPAKEEPFDLSALKAITLEGVARIGSLQVHGIKASNVMVKLAAHGGDVRIAPLSAQLYSGTLDASARIDANAYRFAFAPKLSNIQIGPLMRDGLQLDKLEGRGNMAADVTATGNTVTALKRSLGGSASVRLADGAIKGFDYAKRLADWKTKLSSLGSGGARNEGAAGSADEKTMFSEFSASFAIANGVATNNDLAVKAPLVRLAGAGSIDIGHDSVDYTVKGSVVNTLTGQGGKEIGQAKDITVPVHVHGPYDKIGYEIQWAAVSSSLLKSTVGAKVEEQKQQLQDKAKEQLKDKLKGLLSR